MTRRFRIALTYCKSRKSYVAELANILAAKFGKDGILFDDFHIAELARDDLAFYLPNLYHNDADLVVAIIDNEYLQSEWCGLEWSAIYGAIKKNRHAEVMLTRFDGVLPKGFYGGEGFVELEGKSPTVLAALIDERLVKCVPNTVAPQWPLIDLKSSWNIANHQDVLIKLEELVSESSKFRLLTLCGEAGTGKSTITTILANAAASLTAIDSGRLDFKGGAGIEAEFIVLYDDLRLPAQTSKDGVGGNIAQLFSMLKNRAAQSPTLLIFDTFEMSGAAGDWLSAHLVRILIKAPWMRVLIAGQNTPSFGGTCPAGIVGPTLKLTPPNPNDWFEYGKRHCANRKMLDLDRISWAHEVVGGRPSVLKQMFGSVQ